MHTAPAQDATLPAVPGSSSGPEKLAAGPPWLLQLLDALWPVFQPHSGHASVPAQVLGPYGSVLPVLVEKEEIDGGLRDEDGTLTCFLGNVHFMAQ